MFSLKNLLIVLIIVIFSSIFLTSCKFARIIDLIEKDTEVFFDNYDFSDPRLKPYQINEIIFSPYTIHFPSDYEYSLVLSSYRKKENKSKVIINNVRVEGIKDVKFKKITKELNQELDFKEYKSATCCNMKSIA